MRYKTGNFKPQVVRALTTHQDPEATPCSVEATGNASIQEVGRCSILRVDCLVLLLYYSEVIIIVLGKGC